MYDYGEYYRKRFIAEESKQPDYVSRVLLGFTLVFLLCHLGWYGLRVAYDFA